MMAATPETETRAVYVTGLSVVNLRSIEELSWSVPIEAAPGWHTIVGDNGSGKSTVLRALALALVGMEDAGALRQDWRAWLREEDSSASRVEVTLSVAVSTRTLTLTWLKSGKRVVLVEPEESAATRRAEGPFSAAYGPFRRFTGGDPEYEKQISAFPALARHLSMFDERVALTEGLAWLKDLRFKELERDRGASSLLRDITYLINESKLLPNGARLVEVTSSAVVFTDGHGHKFAIEDLSDGYRSVLSLTLDILRQLSVFFGAERVFDPNRPGIVAAPGVVLIDEVDAHLHPSWQRTVGQWFCDHFPRVQFIVASHSALVCQASERGTVYRLPSPNDDADEGGMLEGADLDRLIYGNILEAYASGAFGLGVTRSESAKKLLRRLAELNQQELSSALTEPEREEQARLRAMFPTQSNIPQGKG